MQDYLQYLLRWSERTQIYKRLSILQINLLNLGMYKVLTVFIIIICLSSCEAIKKQRAINNIAKYKVQYPEMFRTVRIDTVILGMHLFFDGEVLKHVDQPKIDSLDKEDSTLNNKIDKAKKSLKDSNIKDCDTIIRYLEGKTKIKEEQKIIYRDAPCNMPEKTIDTNGHHFTASVKNGKLYVSYDQDDISIQKEGEELKPKEDQFYDHPEWWWTAGAGLISFVVAILAIIRYGRKKDY